MIIQNKKYKIALIGYHLEGGGLEKVMANLSILLEKEGIEVHNVVLADRVGYYYSGRLLNLGKKGSKANTLIDRFNRFWFLKTYLKKNKFDFIIDFRYRLHPLYELFINRIVYSAKTIYTVHNSKLETYLPQNSILTKLIFGNAYKVVCVSKKVEELVRAKYGLTNLATIYNPLNLVEIEKTKSDPIDIDFPYIIGVGRLDGIAKQFDKLIIAYSRSILPQKGIRLVLAGRGDNKKLLEKIAQENNVLEMVYFTGLLANPFKYLSKANFFVLSSLYEGFGLVIAEALACGIPAISFDCISGPNEIIVHKENGLLVENQNLEKLTEAMNLFIEDEALYLHCKNKAKQSAERFSFDSIGKQWLELMNINNK